MPTPSIQDLRNQEVKLPTSHRDRDYEGWQPPFGRPSTPARRVVEDHGEPVGYALLDPLAAILTELRAIRLGLEILTGEALIDEAVN